jgi:hypothetical protein
MSGIANIANCPQRMKQQRNSKGGFGLNLLFEMSLLKHDDVIKQVSAAGANPTFGDSIPLWTAKTSPHRFDAEAPYRADNFLVEVGAAIEDQILRSVVIPEGLA